MSNAPKGRPTAGTEEQTLRRLAGTAEAEPPPRARRVSRQKEAGEVTRRETRRRLLAAAKTEFAERGYTAATVIRIAERADVSVQTLYSNWGNKRNLLRAVMESSVTGDDDLPLVPGQPPAVFADIPAREDTDPAGCWPTSATSTGCWPNDPRSAGRRTGTAPPSTLTSPRTGGTSTTCAGRRSAP